MKNFSNKEKLNESFAMFMKDMRKRNNLSQSDLAKKLSIDVKYLSKLENATKNITFDMFLEFCDILGIRPDIGFSIICNNYLKNMDNTFDKENLYKTKISDLSIDKQILLLEIIEKLEKM